MKVIAASIPTTLDCILELIPYSLHCYIVHFKVFFLRISLMKRIKLEKEGRAVHSVETLITQFDIQPPIHILQKTYQAIYTFNSVSCSPCESL